MSRPPDTTASLKRKVRRLENKIEYLQAEADLYQMMAHDLAGEAVVRTIKKTFPAIARQWAAAEDAELTRFLARELQRELAGMIRSDVEPTKEQSDA